MKNSKYFPFERNKYFFGKLLSVDDFELEQKYINNKRRLLNRFLYGSGVAAGMCVVGTDDLTISIERGLALDYGGREIVIDQPVVKKLSLFEGYDVFAQNRQSEGYLYLCIDYDEQEVNPVHNIVGKQSYSQEAGEFSKVKEGYRLYLTEQEPEQELLSVGDIYENSKTIYWGSGIRIKQSLPKFIQSGRYARLTIDIENMGQQQSFAFSYDLDLTCLSCEGKDVLKVSFNESLVEKSGRYSLTYILKANDVSNIEGTVSLIEESFKLSIDQRQTDGAAEGKNTALIIDHDVKNELIAGYYKNFMEEVIKNNYQQSIYLAKIYMIAAGDTYIINKIENLPFEQLVVNNQLNAAITQIMINDMEQIKSAADFPGGSNAIKPFKENEQKLLAAEGDISIPVQIGAKRGKRFVSEEIFHGLGIGDTTIILGISENEDTVIFGSSEVFEKQKSQFESAVKLNKQNGSFVIGIRLLKEIKKDTLNIHWTAIKDNKEVVIEKKEKKIFIRPNVLNLNIRESHFLEAVCHNMNDKRVRWSVKNNGGTIDENGFYTAPNVAGVYEVTAVSVFEPEIKASIFIVVRNEIKE